VIYLLKFERDSPFGTNCLPAKFFGNYSLANWEREVNDLNII
jgi:hypothetical protein